MVEVGTPVYDGLETERVEGIPDVAVHPPRHPDIYRRLRDEGGEDAPGDSHPPGLPEQRRPSPRPRGALFLLPDPRPAS